MIHAERRVDGINGLPYQLERCAFWPVVTCTKRYVMQPGDRDRHGRVIPYASILRVQCDDCLQWHDAELRHVSWCTPL